MVPLKKNSVLKERAGMVRRERRSNMVLNEKVIKSGTLGEKSLIKSRSWIFYCPPAYSNHWETVRLKEIGAHRTANRVMTVSWFIVHPWLGAIGKLGYGRSQRFWSPSRLLKSLKLAGNRWF